MCAIEIQIPYLKVGYQLAKLAMERISAALAGNAGLFRWRIRALTSGLEREDINGNACMVSKPYVKCRKRFIKKAIKRIRTF
jgi:hypothetical protein